MELPSIPINPELAADPTFRPYLGDELKRAMNYLETKQPERFEATMNVHQRLQPPRGPVEDLRCIGMGVVDGTEEYDHIFHTLTQFAKQDLPPGAFELLLYVNTDDPSAHLETSLASANFQRTLSEIERFQAQHPACPVRYATRTYTQPQTISEIRADLLELAAYDLWLRGRQDNLLALFVDADARFMNEQFLTDMVGTYEPLDADIVTSRLVMQSVRELPYDSAVNHLLRVQSMQYQLVTNYRDRLLTSGPDTAIDFAMALAAGSIDRAYYISEVSVLARAIFSLRRTSGGPSSYDLTRAEQAKGALLKTNSRRLVQAMAIGISPADAWTNESPWLNFQDNPEVRSQAIDFQAAEANAQLYCTEWTNDLFRDSNLHQVPAEVLMRLRALVRQHCRFDAYDPGSQREG